MRLLLLSCGVFCDVDYGWLLSDGYEYRHYSGDFRRKGWSHLAGLQRCGGGAGEVSERQEYVVQLSFVFKIDQSVCVTGSTYYT